MNATRFDTPLEMLDHHPHSAITIEDYSTILDKKMLCYTFSGYHYLVGDLKISQGWILHISVVRSQVFSLLTTIIDTLILTRVPFKIAKDKDTVRNILDGSLGQCQIGKIISIYPDNNELAIFLAKNLIQLTMPYKGPAVLTDVHLGANVYTRYGSFTTTKFINDNGKQTNYIFSPTGKLVSDDYNIPFLLPEGILWPFGQLADSHIKPRPSTINNIYRPIQFLKSDPKGSVIKALYLKKLLVVSWCVLKQGKRDMWSDDLERDIPARLLWQKKLHEKLRKLVPLPAIIDCFTEDGDTYLAMEYIKGPSLYNQLQNENKNCLTWACLLKNQQLVILDYLAQIIRVLKTFHKEGYVHRDITPVNFLVNRKQRLSLIDIELAYSLSESKPSPPFEAGTFGFMSPEQINVQTPTILEDIYGLGATIVTLITGLSPIIFDIYNRSRLSESLHFFIGNENLADALLATMAIDPSERPTLLEIEKTIAKYQTSIKNGTTHSKPDYDTFKIDDGALKTIINGGILGLISAPTVISDNIWQSETADLRESQGQPRLEYTTAIGLSEGLAGILHFISIAHKQGYNIEKCNIAYTKSVQLILTKYLQNLSNIFPGFYGGSAGVALALASGLYSGLLTEAPEIQNLIQDSLNRPCDGPNIATGYAGQGIAALQCAPYLDEKVKSAIFNRAIGEIVDAYHKYDYWVISKSANGKTAPCSSLSFGNSGIIWFLLEYSQSYINPQVQTVALDSLKTLEKSIKYLKQAIVKNGIRSLFLGNHSYSDAYQGTILAFIKGYEFTHDKHYQQLAEDLLFQLSKFPVHDNFNQNTGLSGLGELYLEAYRVFKNEEFQLRARWIANCLIHTSIKNRNGSYYWLPNNHILPTADFMVGNSGILHFLMRVAQPDRLGYRTLKWPY